MNLNSSAHRLILILEHNLVMMHKQKYQLALHQPCHKDPKDIQFPILYLEPSKVHQAHKFRTLKLP